MFDKYIYKIGNNTDFLAGYNVCKVSNDERKMFAGLVERKLGHAKNKLKSRNASPDDKLLYDELCAIAEKIGITEKV